MPVAETAAIPMADTAATAETADQDTLLSGPAMSDSQPPAAQHDEALPVLSADEGAPVDADVADLADVAAVADAADAADVTDTANVAGVAGVTGAAGAPVAPADLSPAQCSARLGQLFPALFRLQQPLPLKLRIQADIQARAPGVFTRKSLSGFLHRYTTGTPYLLALTRQTQRFDLEGQPAGELAAEHREAATAELARRRAIVEERRAAEQTAQREAQAAQRQQHEAEQQGRRERALLLRAFESSTLTRANFCALKGLNDSSLDTLLAQARQEAAERPAWAEDRPPPRRDDGRRPGPGPNGRQNGPPNGPPNVQPHRQPSMQPSMQPDGRPSGRPSGRPGAERSARGPSRPR